MRTAGYIHLDYKRNLHRYTSSHGIHRQLQFQWEIWWSLNAPLNNHPKLSITNQKDEDRWGDHTNGTWYRKVWDNLQCHVYMPFTHKKTHSSWSFILWMYMTTKNTFASLIMSLSPATCSTFHFYSSSLSIHAY